MNNSNTLWKGTRQKRQVVTKLFSPQWSNAKVFYCNADSFSKLQLKKLKLKKNSDTVKRKLMKFAMNFISSQTCVTFEENCTISTRIKFVDSTFCASYVGMINSVQEIYFPDWCMRVSSCILGFGEILHENNYFKSNIFSLDPPFTN